MALCAVVAVLDVLVGHGGVLVGLLIVGPCCGVLTGRWSQTALLTTWAVVLATVLGFVDGPWASVAHLAFLTVAVVVGGRQHAIGGHHRMVQLKALSIVTDGRELAIAIDNFAFELWECYEGGCQVARRLRGRRSGYLCVTEATGERGSRARRARATPARSAKTTAAASS